MPTEPLCDLVLLSWNHLEVTRPCVESILAHTSVSSRLIIVDQNSDPETQATLRGVRSTSTVQVEVLFNPANVGYPRGMNLGFRHGKAPYVCFLNNDILVPPCWLEEIIAVADSDRSIGTVSPASNTFDIHPPAGTDWLGFARQCAARRGRWLEIPYGEGFCLLARRELLEKIGGFDETTYEQIYFEDADLGRKVQAENLRCVMATGTYVWHHGGKTMNAHPDRLRLFQENRRRFTAKWGPEGKDQLYILSRSNETVRSRCYDQARAEANRSGNIVFLTGADRAGWKPTPHLNIRWSVRPNWILLSDVLSRTFKKKKVSEIYCDSNGLRFLLRRLGWLHRAEVRPVSCTMENPRTSSGR